MCIENKIQKLHAKAQHWYLIKRVRSVFDATESLVCNLIENSLYATNNWHCNSA